MQRFATCFALVLAAGILPYTALSATASIAQILNSPSTFDGSHVSVTGKVEDLEQKTSRKGNAYVTFSLCSSRCIHVFAFGSPSISDGQTVNVRGMFSAVKHVGAYTFTDEIEADDGSL